MSNEDETELKTRFGRRCKALRLQCGKSQLDMVRFHEFSLSHYQKLERGDLDPRLSTIRRRADAFGVTVSGFFEDL